MTAPATLTLDGEDISNFIIMSLQSIVRELSVLIFLLYKRGIPEENPEFKQLSADFNAYNIRLELAMKIHEELHGSIEDTYQNISYN